MEDIYFEVDFAKYCKTCKYKNVDSRQIPCCYCLDEPVNLHSVKPVKWVDKDKEDA